MARVWLWNLKSDPDPPERPDSVDDPQPTEPTHQQYKVDDDGVRTTSVGCYCNAKSDHPRG